VAAIAAPPPWWIAAARDHAEGVRRRNRRYADAETIEKVRAPYVDETTSGEAVATELRVARSTVYYWLGQAGIPRRPSWLNGGRLPLARKTSEGNAEWLFTFAMQYEDARR
jgi:hypothetical protein